MAKDINIQIPDFETPNRMVHRLNGHDFEHTQGDGEGQGSLVHCSPWGRKEQNMPEPLNNKQVNPQQFIPRHTIVKFPKDKENILKTMRKK